MSRASHSLVRWSPVITGVLTRVSVALCLGGWLWLALPAQAEAGIFKCQGPDGRVVYTSDPSACPGAEPHELKTEMQTVVPGSSPRRPTPVPAASGRNRAAKAGGSAGSAAVSDGMANMWRRKRTDAETKLANLKKRAEYLHSVIGGCNRGSTWWVTDEAGLRHQLSCDEIRSRREQVEREIATLEAYLSGGLEEECRRAGCLPGWIR